MLKVTFEKPQIPIADSVKHIFEKKHKKKSQEKKPWTYKERAIVAAVLLLTLILSAYLWYTSGKFPKLDVGFFPFNETVVIEK